MTFLQQKSADAVKKEWQAHLRSHEDVFRSNKAAPQDLHFLAAIYFGRATFANNELPRSCLGKFLEDDRLVELALAAFRQVPNRPDLPNTQEAFAMAANGQMPYLAWPFLAGLAELATPSGGNETPLHEGRLLQALAVHALYDPAPYRAEPKWHLWAVAHKAKLVADTIVTIYEAGLRGGLTRQYGLYELAHHDAYAEVARLSIMPMLSAFPARAQSVQLEMLTPVLAAALTHCDANEFCEIVDSKVATKSMGSKQKLFWLSAGLLCRPESYRSRLDRELEGGASQRRVRWAAEFLGSDGIHRHFVRLHDTRTAALLIRRMGPAFRPFSIDGGPRVFSTMPGDTLIDRLISVAAKEPNAEATTLLGDLMRDGSLAPWHQRLRQAAWQQTEVRRNAEFRHSQVVDVVEALAGRKPANAADLLALTYRELVSLGREIRDGQTSDWQQYWHTAPEAHDPLPENICRDRLLSDLSSRLRHFKVVADKEPTYADDKRADIRVSIGNCNVPVEIKKSNSKDLWTAIRCQLIPKYTRDPPAEWHGIFLVFWFGPAFCTPPKDRVKPKDATALQTMLVDPLTAAEQHRIKVLVIDVSRPITSQ